MKSLTILLFHISRPFRFMDHSSIDCPSLSLVVFSKGKFFNFGFTLQGICPSVFWLPSIKKSWKDFLNSSLFFKTNASNECSWWIKITQFSGLKIALLSNLFFLHKPSHKCLLSNVCTLDKCVLSSVCTLNKCLLLQISHKLVLLSLYTLASLPYELRSLGPHSTCNIRPNSSLERKG